MCPQNAYVSDRISVLIVNINVRHYNNNPVDNNNTLATVDNNKDINAAVVCIYND